MVGGPVTLCADTQESVDARPVMEFEVAVSEEGGEIGVITADQGDVDVGFSFLEGELG